VLEVVDRRVLAALRFVSAATGLPVEGSPAVSASGLRFVRNRLGLLVVYRADGYRAQTDAFEGQPGGVPVSFQGVVVDPDRRYLPRRFTLDLLRDADPQSAGDAGSLFTPVEVELYLSPTAARRATWAVVRGTVRDAVSGDPVGGALVRLMPSLPGARAVWGMSQPALDARTGRPLRTAGEVMLAIPDLPVITWAADENDVLLEHVSVAVEVRLVGAGQAMPAEPVAVPDPAALAALPPMGRLSAEDEALAWLEDLAAAHGA
jgi:hypothetical protein